MRVSGYRPTNRWLHRQLDESWHLWLARLAALAACIAVTLAAFVGPRQTAVRLRYRIADLDAEVERLAQEQRRLRLEREELVSPPALAGELDRLSLVPLTPERVAFLSADGTLVPLVDRPLEAASEGTPR